MEDISRTATSGQLVCKFCTDKVAQYTCPRCKANYCSLACYRDRRHGKCSEKFYRECCRSAIRNLSVDDEKRIQIERMLSQDLEFDGEDEMSNVWSEAEGSDDETELSERLKDIDLMAENIDIDKIWEALSAEEKREFHRQIATGSIYASIPVWTPWWQSTSKKLVTSFPDDFMVDLENQFSCGDAEPLSKLISTDPHPSIIYSLAELIFGFAFVARFFNGDHLKDMSLEACDLLLKLVSYLHPNGNHEDPSNKTRVIHCRKLRMHIYTNVAEVLASIKTRLAENRLDCSSEVMLLLTDDLYCILQDPSKHLNHALCDVSDMLKASKLHNQMIVTALRKVKFMLACVCKKDVKSILWCEDYIPRLVKEVETAICGQTSLVESESSQPGVVKQKVAGPNWRKIIRQIRAPEAPLIEEINLPPVSDDSA